MAKVTYLLGAGASAQCLPVVNKIPNAIEELRMALVHYNIENKSPFTDFGNPITLQQGKESLIKQIETFYQQVKLHASIDTFAKKLFITRKDHDYKILKVILTSLFVFLQYKNEIDYRCDSFFASILDQHHFDLAKNIRILSWNYDFQFENGYAQFSGKNSFAENQLILGIYSGGILEKNFSIYKINGTTTYSTDNYNSENLYPNVQVNDMNFILERIVWFYLAATKFRDKVTPQLCFAWERKLSNGNNTVIESACNAINECEVLVVIGYSFPFFNREIDRKIIASMSNGNPMKIYIQDKDPQNIIEKLDSVLPPKVIVQKIPIHAVDQFYLPPEL